MNLRKVKTNFLPQDGHLSYFQRDKNQIYPEDVSVEQKLSMPGKEKKMEIYEYGTKPQRSIEQSQKNKQRNYTRIPSRVRNFKLHQNSYHFLPPYKKKQNISRSKYPKSSDKKKKSLEDSEFQDVLKEFTDFILDINRQTKKIGKKIKKPDAKPINGSHHLGPNNEKVRKKLPQQASYTNFANNDNNNEMASDMDSNIKESSSTNLKSVLKTIVTQTKFGKDGEEVQVVKPNIQKSKQEIFEEANKKFSKKGLYRFKDEIKNENELLHLNKVLKKEKNTNNPAVKEAIRSDPRNSAINIEEHIQSQDKLHHIQAASLNSQAFLQKLPSYTLNPTNDANFQQNTNPTNQWFKIIGEFLKSNECNLGLEEGKAAKKQLMLSKYIMHDIESLNNPQNNIPYESKNSNLDFLLPCKNSTNNLLNLLPNTAHQLSNNIFNQINFGKDLLFQGGVDFPQNLISHQMGNLLRGNNQIGNQNFMNACLLGGVGNANQISKTMGANAGPMQSGTPKVANNAPQNNNKSTTTVKQNMGSALNYQQGYWSKYYGHPNISGNPDKPFKRASTHVAIAYFIHLKACGDGEYSKNFEKMDPTYHARKLREKKAASNGYLSDQMKIENEETYENTLKIEKAYEQNKERASNSGQFTAHEAPPVKKESIEIFREVLNKAQLHKPFDHES